MVSDPRTIKKARLLIENNAVRQIEDNNFQVKSLTNPEMFYQVFGNHCNCKGFKNFFIRHNGLNPTCSHLEAVKIFKENSKH